MKKRYLHIIFLIAFLLMHSFCFSQNPMIDSLENNIKFSPNDTNKIKTLNNLSWMLENTGERSRALRAAGRALVISDSLLLKNKDKKSKLALNKGKAKAFGNLGIIYADLGNYPLALQNLSDAIVIKKVILIISEKEGNKNEIKKNKQTLASSYNNIAIIYENQGNYVEALKNDFESLKISESINDSAGIGRSYNSIGLVYSDQGNYKDALTNFFISLKIKESLGDSQGIAGSYENIGGVYKAQYKFNDALHYYSTGAEIFKSIGDPYGLETGYGNVGTIYMDLGNFPESQKYHFEALKIQEEIGDPNGMAISYINLGDLSLRTNKQADARQFLAKGLAISKSIGSKSDLRDCYLLLSQSDSIDNNFKAVLSDIKFYVIYRDSLVNEENTKKSVRFQMQYDFDKKTATDSIKNAEEKKRTDLKHDQEIQKQKTYAYGGGIGFLLMLIVAGVSFRAFRQKQKANKIISHQKLLVEEKQKEILDSIYYARRIQKSLLPTEKYIERNLLRLKKR